MIDELYVKDVALIREAHLYPARGLTAITGETGAGKTALLSALKLVAGERADASMVRDGAPRLQVQARIFAEGVDEGQDCCADAAEGMVVSRSVSADGRGRVHLDGAMVPVGTLAQKVGSTIDLCGQHEHQRLLKPANHQAMLDAWMGTSAQEGMLEYVRAFGEVEAARAEVERIQEARNLSEQQVEQSRFVLRRIGEVDPRPGEYEELCEKVPKLENAELLSRAVEEAVQLLSRDGGALDLLGNAVRAFESTASVEPELAAYAESLLEASYVLEDVARDVRRYGDGIDYDMSGLAAMQDRMAAMQGLMRTWGPGMDQVFQARDQAAATVAAVDGFEEQMARAEKRLNSALAELGSAGKTLHAMRSKAAPTFAREVCTQMARLEMGDARLECQVEAKPFDQWTGTGPDKVEFMFKPGERLQARPLAKIASGGEISRVMLAIKVVLGASDHVDTLVFDEVDAGVGGTAARALAEVLVDLALTHQVIVVTHLAQLAAPAQAHYVVSKTGGEDPQTGIRQVEDEERVVEIARMLSGDSDAASLDHARQMLQQAGGQ